MKKQKGVSLIVLIVTIIVVIILAAVVILTLSKNNPIESAKEATFKEDVRIFQDELSMYIANDYAAKVGKRDYKITATGYEKDESSSDYANSVYKYIPSYKAKYDGKFIIKNDELRYNEEINEQEKNWCQSLNIKENSKTGAEKAKEEPTNYYGKEVNYTAPNGVNKWKIFYSDGNNVYLISSEYVNPVVQSPAQPQLPSKNNVSLDQGNATNYPKAARFNNILSKYSTGSAGITDEKMKAFNSDYYKERVKAETGETYVFSSGNNANFKAVAYMLDKEIWSALYANSSAEYAVGGPSVEMLMKSYCITHSDKKDLYKTQAVSSTGYQVSNNGGTSYANSINGMLSTSDTLYVLPSAATSGADAMWLASPSAYDGNYVVYVYYSGYVSGCYYDNTYIGFRPLVCLNSNILLNWNDQTQKYDIE